MKLLKHIFIVHLLFYVTIGYSQDQIDYQFKVVDSDNKPISLVTLKVNHQKLYTNDQGIINLTLKPSKKYNISIQTIQYQDTSFVLSLSNKKENISIIKLQSIELPTYTVQANKNPDTVFGSTIYSISDYCLLPSGEIIALGYKNTLRKNPSILKIENGEIESIQNVQKMDRPIALYNDYQNNIYYITEKTVYSKQGFKAYKTKENVVYNIKHDDTVIGLSNVSNEDYETSKRILSDLNDFLIVSNYSSLYPAVTFSHLNLYFKAIDSFYTVTDQFMMDMYRAEYKFLKPHEKLWATRKEFATGVDREIWAGAKYFSQNILYNSTYAPLQQIEDKIYIFDHYKNEIIVFNSEFDIIKKVKINYHIKPKPYKWNKTLIKDQENDNCYTLYEKNGYQYLVQINLKTGQHKILKKLYYRFIENIQIYNNKVYYIYRPYESVQKKFLYSEYI